VEEVKEMLIDRDKHIRFNKLLDYITLYSI